VSDLVVVTKEVWTETGHRLHNYDGPCRNIHGHSYRWLLSVTGIADDVSGMLIDFGNLKHIMMEEIHAKLDHSMVLHRDDPMVSRFGSDLHQFGRIVLVPYMPTAEMLCAAFAKNVAARFVVGGRRGVFTKVLLKVWETASSSAEHTINL
jgi:6-pyruvoyltetrahydropterin/6-carboxytetrahydropterin synthase